jgi:integration host factor subunit alpha
LTDFFGKGTVMVNRRKDCGMTEQTVTRAQLSDAVYQEVGLSRNESADLLELVLNEMVAALTRGESVKISSFGSFSIRSKGTRVGRNPKTGEEVPILPRRVLVFRASQLLKSRINDGLAKAAARSQKS